MGNAPHILVCEPDRKGGSLLRELLERAGFRVNRAASAREVVQRLGRHHYDAMTLNPVLPDLDGVSLIRDLRVLELSLPILGVSLGAYGEGAAPQASLREPHWVRQAASLARPICAIKTAIHASRGFRPRILQIEPDPFCTDLVASALRGGADLMQVSNQEQLGRALRFGPYDLALLNPLAGRAAAAQLQAVAATDPGLPLFLHTAYDRRGGMGDLYPVERAGGQQGLGLVEALRILALHGMSIPLLAQA